jgi:hypothetical protein
MTASMRTALLFLGLGSCLLNNAQAQTLITTHGNLLAVTNKPVPGPSARISNHVRQPVIADDGPSCSTRTCI